MKILKLEASNIKKLSAIEVAAGDASVIQVSGPNGIGKTTVLDSIWWALTGKDNIQKQPIKNGEDKAFITLDMGELIVTRKFSRKGDNNYTTTLEIKNADGAKFPSPQSMLDRLLGELSFDPLEFTRLSARDQYDRMRLFVPDVDFEQIGRDNKADFEARTVHNRRAKEERTIAEGSKLDLTEPPAERIDITELTKEISDASEKNADTQTRSANRETMKERIQGYKDQAAALEQQMKTLTDKAEELQKKLDEAGELPEVIDLTALNEKLQNAQQHNELFDQWAKHDDAIKAAEEHEEESEKLSRRIEERNQVIFDAIKNAELPVDGIEFGDGEILVNGAPFAQASTAQQLRISVAIAMAANPDIRVLRVTDGSLLDNQSMDMITEMVEQKDYQLWIETVGNTDDMEIIIDTPAENLTQIPEGTYQRALPGKGANVDERI